MPYRYAVLPLDTPDDDPRWQTYGDIFAMTLLGGRRTQEGQAIFREHRRADNAVLGMVVTEGPGLDGEQPVAEVNVADSRLNAGRGDAGVAVINTVGVLPSHRRRGLMTTMMKAQLDAAVERGNAYAALSASEATIYGRFGFGVAMRGAEFEVATRKLVYRPGVEVADGSVEFLPPSNLEPHWRRITDAHHARYRGSVRHQSVHGILDTARWDPEASAPSMSLRAVVHFDADGVADGFALFSHKGWNQPIEAQVHKVCSADPADDRALWLALAQMDLVEKLTYDLTSPSEPLALAASDSRAVRFKEVSDWVWLRILDLPAATESRAFDADGEVVIDVADPMGYCAGTWRISAVDGVGRAERTDAPPGMTLGIDQLAQLWLGDRSAGELARAGAIVGDPDAVIRLSGLLAWAEPAVNLARY